jgi:hypothetical protein
MTLHRRKKKPLAVISRAATEGKGKACEGVNPHPCDALGTESSDARSWFSTEDVFCDGLHQLPKGARRFTTRFAGEVVPRLPRPTSGGLVDGLRRYARNVNKSQAMISSTTLP